jgi:phage head maturation protease
MKEVKDFKFQVKSVNEDGTFEGYSAVYGNVDLGGDVVEPGAFTKTLSDRKNQPPFITIQSRRASTLQSTP